MLQAWGTDVAIKQTEESDACSKVRLGKPIPDEFAIRNDPKQGDHIVTVTC